MFDHLSLVTSFPTNQALAISKELEDEQGEGVVRGNLGMADEILCNLDSAQEEYKKVRMIGEQRLEPEKARC